MDTTPSAAPQNTTSGRDPTPPTPTVTDVDDPLKVGRTPSNVPRVNPSNPEGQNVGNIVQPEDTLVADGHIPTSNKLFTCSFCLKSFGTSQALGGHQNAHRQERHLVRTINVMHEEGQHMLMGHTPYQHGLRPSHPPNNQSFYPFQPPPPSPFGISSMPWPQGGGGRPIMPPPPQYPSYSGPLFDGSRFSLELNNKNNNNDLNFDGTNPWHHFAKVPSWKSRATEQRLAYELRPYTKTYQGPHRTVQDGVPSKGDNGQGSSTKNQTERRNKQPAAPAPPVPAYDNDDEELDLTLRL